MDKLQPVKDQTAPSTKPTNIKTSEEEVTRPSSACAANATKPSRKRYTRSYLLKLNENVKLREPPSGYNPSVLKQTDGGGREIPPREGVKWNRTGSLGGGGWAGRTSQGKGNVSYSRLVEGMEDAAGGQSARGRALRSAVSWNEDRGSNGGNGGPGTTPQDRTFVRRNSRSDAPGRWDNNKDELSRSLEKRPNQGPERWPSYGHRDHKEKHGGKGGREEPGEELMPPPPIPQQYSDREPEWMHHRETKNSVRAEQHRKSAADFEQQRKQMRETLAKEKRDGNTGGENAMFMTDEEINKYKKELEAEERGMTTSAFTFDSLKEALKSQGVSNLPPMPTSGISTVDQIEKSMKATGTTTATTTSTTSHPTVSEIERQRQELLRATGGGGQAVGNTNTGGNIGQSGGSNFEGASLLLSMLKGQNRAAGGGPGPFMHPGQVPQQVGFPSNLQQQQQQQQLFAGSGTTLERLFAANQRAGLQSNMANLGLGFGGTQQQIGLPNAPATGAGGGLNTINVPYMQQANQQQLNQRLPVATGPGVQQNPLLSALIANQPQQNAQQRQNQAQMLARLKQAQQQTALQNSRSPGMQGGVVGEKDFGMNSSRSAPTSGNEIDLDKDNSEGAQGSGAAGNPSPSIPNALPFPSFGLAGQGNFMPARPSIGGIPGVGINPSLMSAAVGGGQPGGVFQGGGLGNAGHPNLFMQNGGGGLGRPSGPPPGLNPLAFAGMRPNVGAGALAGIMDARQGPQMSIPIMPTPNQGANLQASMFVAQQQQQQQQQQQNTSGLNRFFGLNDFGTNPAASFVQTPGDLVQSGTDKTGRGRSLEGLKNEAQ